MFLHGDELTKKIRSILKEPNLMCAVAYWGAESQGWLEPEDPHAAVKKRIICDALSGGSNPNIIRDLRGRSDVEIRHCEALHAKVYIGSGECVVGSSNASTNGVGAEGGQTSGLIEAGYLASPTPEIKDWFEALWSKKAQPITEEDLKRATKAWEKRRRLRPKASFADFDFNATNLPLIYWYWDEDLYDVRDPASLKEANEADYLALTSSDQSRGQAINFIASDTRRDTSALELNPWLLMFPITEGNKISKALKYVQWFVPGRLIKGGLSLKGKTEARDAFLPADDPGTEPFNLREKHVWPAILKTLSNNEFKDIIGLDYETPAYNGIEYLSPKRIERHRDFWKACKAEYLEMAGAIKI
jgi:hypothetical protein